MRAYVFSVFFHTLSLFVFFVFSFGSFIPLSSSLSTFRSTYPRREVFCRIVYVCNSRCYISQSSTQIFKCYYAKNIRLIRVLFLNYVEQHTQIIQLRVHRTNAAISMKTNLWECHTITGGRHYLLSLLCEIQ